MTFIKPSHQKTILLLPLLAFMLITTNSKIDLVSGQFSSRFDGGRTGAETGSDLTRLTTVNDSSSGGGLIWPPLRATFRPLNRQSAPPRAPTPPSPPTAPTPPLPPPEPLAFTSSDSSSSSLFDSGSLFDTSRIPLPPPPPQPQPSSTQPPASESVTFTPASLPTTTPNTLDDEDLPTRASLNRFRPTKPPSIDSPTPAVNAPIGSSSSSFSSQPANFPTANPTTLTNNQQPSTTFNNNNNNTNYRITNECFECICEASTSCNANSRCQTSDVRHTRCGMFLISYVQWVESDLSKQLVTQEALLRDAAADERAFYECVTERTCAERLLTIYLQKNGKDCDRDGRVDCYDLAAIHQGGVGGCNSEGLLESQYWSDFNACFGFGR